MLYFFKYSMPCSLHGCELAGKTELHDHGLHFFCVTKNFMAFPSSSFFMLVSFLLQVRQSASLDRPQDSGSDLGVQVVSVTPPTSSHQLSSPSKRSKPLKVLAEVSLVQTTPVPSPRRSKRLSESSDTNATVTPSPQRLTRASRSGLSPSPARSPLTLRRHDRQTDEDSSPASGRSTRLVCCHFELWYVASETRCLGFHLLCLSVHICCVYFGAWNFCTYFEVHVPTEVSWGAPVQATCPNRLIYVLQKKFWLHYL